jgi:hypothetical protein
VAGVCPKDRGHADESYEQHADQDNLTRRFISLTRRQRYGSSGNRDEIVARSCVRSCRRFCLHVMQAE